MTGRTRTHPPRTYGTHASHPSGTQGPVPPRITSVTALFTTPVTRQLDDQEDAMPDPHPRPPTAPPPLAACRCGHGPLDHGGHPRSVGPCDVPWCRCARFDLPDPDGGWAA
jgi:hypothetical protein